MKLSELRKQYLIHDQFKRELREWKRMSWWHNSENMMNHFKSFIKFRRNVLNDMDIEQALSEWIGADFNDRHAVKNKMNVPQLWFYDAYNRAHSLTIQLQREENEIPYLS